VSQVGEHTDSNNNRRKGRDDQQGSSNVDIRCGAGADVLDSITEMSNEMHPTIIAEMYRKYANTPTATRIAVNVARIKKISAAPTLDATPLPPMIWRAITTMSTETPATRQSAPYNNQMMP
jgi:hypothetical protein